MALFSPDITQRPTTWRMFSPSGRRIVFWLFKMPFPLCRVPAWINVLPPKQNCMSKLLLHISVLYRHQRDGNVLIGVTRGVCSY